MRIQALVAGAAMALAATVSAGAAELVSNGDFSAGSIGWSVSSNAFNFGGAAYHEGSIGAEGSISQTFLDAVGGLLTLEYDWSGAGYQYVVFNGATVAGSLTQNTSGHYTFSLGAGTGSDTIAFFGRNDPNYNALDNVSITRAGAIPEPGSWALMIAGFLGAGAAIRVNRRRQGAFSA